MDRDVLVIGAGISGLRLAGQLARQGRQVAVLERARGVGGRCATRRVDGVAVDHGVPLIHGRSEELAGILDELPDAEKIHGWPLRVRGPGTPCQPEAYRSGSVRVALRSGVSALAKHLARGVDVKLGVQVRGIERHGGTLRVVADGGTWEAGCVVVSAPPPEAAGLLAGLGDGGEMAGVRALVRRVIPLPCLTLLAGYDRVADDGFDLVLPGPSSPVHSLINDGSKRGSSEGQVLVVQAAPGWSRRMMDGDEDAWTRELLDAAARELGGWVLEPAWVQAHAWRHARVQPGDEMSHPVLVRLDGGAMLGLCGDAFHPAGGVEGALMSGRELAARILTDTDRRTNGGG